MDSTLVQIIDDLIRANQEIVRLRQENEALRNPPNPEEVPGTPSAATSYQEGMAQMNGSAPKEPVTEVAHNDG